MIQEFFKNMYELDIQEHQNYGKEHLKLQKMKLFCIRVIFQFYHILVVLLGLHFQLNKNLAG